MINLNEVWGRAEVKLITPRSAIRLGPRSNSTPLDQQSDSLAIVLRGPTQRPYHVNTCLHNFLKYMSIFFLHVVMA